MATAYDSPTEKPSPSNLAVAGAMVLASRKSAVRFLCPYAKGMLVDLPPATAESFSALPRLCGDKAPQSHGAVMAGKTFALGISEGAQDAARRPVKGTASLLCRTAGGGRGLVAYAGQEIWRNLWGLGHGGTGRRVGDVRRAEGRWMIERERRGR
jgi:hypothetical protein